MRGKRSEQKSISPQWSLKYEEALVYRGRGHFVLRLQVFVCVWRGGVGGLLLEMSVC